MRAILFALCAMAIAIHFYTPAIACSGSAAVKAGCNVLTSPPKPPVVPKPSPPPPAVRPIPLAPSSSGLRTTAPKPMPAVPAKPVIAKPVAPPRQPRPVNDNAAPKIPTENVTAAGAVRAANTGIQQVDRLLDPRRHFQTRDKLLGIRARLENSRAAAKAAQSRTLAAPKAGLDNSPPMRKEFDRARQDKPLPSSVTGRGDAGGGGRPPPQKGDLTPVFNKAANPPPAPPGGKGGLPPNSVSKPSGPQGPGMN